MTSGAGFKIRNITLGGAWSPFADSGFDATAGDVLEVQLEASPALDVRTCRYSVVAASKGASSLVFAGNGVASPPAAAVQVTVPSGVHSWMLRCQTNGGEGALDGSGRPDFSVNTRQRVVSVRSAAGLRKGIATETTEYSPTGGWMDAQNEEIDAIGLGGAGGPPTFTQVQTACAAATGSLGLNSQRITSLADPSGTQDAATKAYVDAHSAPARPTDLPTCRLWVTAGADVVAPATLDAPIWYDQSGYGYHLRQTAASAPVAGTRGGKACAVFDGSGEQLAATRVRPTQLIQELALSNLIAYEWHALVWLDAAATDYTDVSGGAAYANNTQIIGWGDGYGGLVCRAGGGTPKIGICDYSTWGSGANTWADVEAAIGAWHVVCAWREDKGPNSTGYSSVMIDGATYINTTPVAQTIAQVQPAQLQVGGYAGRWFVGGIRDLALYQGVLSPARRAEQVARMGALL